MWRHPFIRILFLAYVAWGAWNWFASRPVHPADGVLAPDDPVQVEISAATRQVHGRWQLTPRATYRINARILGIERYRFDALAALVPEDLALGWGPMSDNRLLRSIDVTQSNRFYYWRMTGPPQFARELVIAHSANTHVIPDGRAVAVQLSRLRRGQVVTLAGELVDGRRDDGAWLNTSLSRTDTGAGACEVLLVHDVVVVP